MPSSISMAKRQSIIACHKRGESVSILSRKFEVSRKTIYTLIKREKSEGLAGLRPRYDRCGKARPDPKGYVYRAVRCLRTWHPSWGAQKICAEMHRMRPNLCLPHYRTFYRWFHWNQQIEVKIKTQLPKNQPRTAKALHEGWQLDAKEQMQIADGSYHCWLNITDEYSGAVIDPPVFSL